MLAKMPARWIVIMLVLIGCRRESPPAGERSPASTPGPASNAASGSAAAPHDAGAIDAALADIELLHNVPTTVVVGSTVANQAILPAHIADGDFQTAWNSVTGELVGAWFEITVEPGAQIRELRMTVGHTGRGRKGEDYFVMNPRIKSVSVTANHKPAGRFELDVTRRSLQSIAVPPSQHVGVVVKAVVAGSKKAWREVSVSELEVWGTPPPGWLPPVKPRVPTVEVATPEPTDGPCGNIEAVREAWNATHKLGPDEHPDHAYPPACNLFDVVLPGDPAWTQAVQWCEASDEIYGPTTCNLSIGGGAAYSLDSMHATARMTVELTALDILPGGANELVVRFAISDEAEYVGVCRASPAVTCAEPMQIAASDWKTSFRFERGKLVRATTQGTPPPDLLRPAPLVFR